METQRDFEELLASFNAHRVDGRRDLADLEALGER